MRTLALITTIAVLSGCGPSNPPTAKVTGTVTLDGNPVEGAVITFMPDDGENKPAIATSLADGNYSLTTFKTGDGAMLGSYKIKVFKYTLPDGGMSPYGNPAEEVEEAPAKDPADMTIEEQLAAMEQGYTAQDAKPQGKEEVAKNQLPEKFANHTNSGLAYTVVDGDNTYNIELTSK